MNLSTAEHNRHANTIGILGSLVVDLATTAIDSASPSPPRPFALCKNRLNQKHLTRVRTIRRRLDESQRGKKTPNSSRDKKRGTHRGEEREEVPAM